MNLNSIVAPIVAAINPPMSVTVQQSSGSTIAADGSRVPTYLAPVTLSAQVQSLTYSDLQKLDGLNIQGEKRALYLNGNWQGVIRPDGRGGDLVTLPDGSVWLTTMVLENWSLADGWVKIAITRQNGS